MMVEAAIFLPIFIISVGLLACIIKAIWLNIFIVEAATDQVRKYEIGDAVLESVSEDILGNSLDIKPNILLVKSKIASELEKYGLEGENLKLTNMLVSMIPEIANNNTSRLYTINKGDFALHVAYDVDMKLPKKIVDKLQIKKCIKGRVWCGIKYSINPVSFSEMQIDGESKIVAVFPMAGECYHDLSCKTLSANKEERKLTNMLRKTYAPCPLCCENNEVKGQPVYIFKYGACYHEADCSCVKKNYITMELRDAKTREYRSCKVCGG